VRGWAHWGLAYSNFLLGNTVEARGQFLASLELGRSTNDEAMIAGTMLGMALFSLNAGRPVEAAELLAASEQTARATNYTFWSVDRLLYDEVTGKLREQLTADQLSAAAERGRRLSRDEAMRIGMAAVELL
jgi:hypothetical protein